VSTPRFPAAGAGRRGSATGGGINNIAYNGVFCSGPTVNGVGTTLSTSRDSCIKVKSPDDGTVGGRLIAMNGAFSNVILGVVLYCVFRVVTRSNGSLTWRVFLWLLAALNVFIRFIYLFCSGISGVADWSNAIAGLPHHGLLRVLEVVSGAVLSAGTVVFFATSFARFPESLWRLSLVPFFASTLVLCLAGLRIPNGAQLMVISVIPAAVLGQSILVLVTPIARRLRTQTAPAEVIATSSAALERWTWNHQNPEQPTVKLAFKFKPLRMTRSYASTTKSPGIASKDWLILPVLTTVSPARFRTNGL
jgi:hypothetical protein